jgi:hypothetical protein
VPSQQADGADAGRASEDRLEEAPTVVGYAREIDRQLAEHSSLTCVTSIRHQCTTQLPPTSGKSDVDESPNSALPERENSMRSAHLELTQERDGGDARKFANHRSDSPWLLTGTAHGDEYRLYLTRFEISNEIIDAFTMERSIATFAGCIHTQSFGGSQQRGDRWKLRRLLAIVGHEPPREAEK